MRNIKPITSVAAAAMAIASLSACGGGSPSAVDIPDDCKPAHEFETVDEGKLTVVTFDFPPYSMVEGNELSGVDGDIAKEIALMECLPLQVKTAGVSAVVPTAEDGRADLAIGDWYRTETRAKVLNLSDPLYLDQMALVSEDGIASIPEIKEGGLTVGTPEGFLWVQELEDYLGGNLSTYPTALNCYQDLEAGRIDVCADALGAATHATEGDDVEVVVAEPFDGVAASVEPAQTTFPMPKGYDDMLKAINEDIATLHENGTIAEILEKYGLDPAAADVGQPKLIPS